MKILLILLLSLVLGACSDSGDQSSAPAKPANKAYNPWQDQMKALDQAKQLEGQVQQELEKRDQRLREQGG